MSQGFKDKALRVFGEKRPHTESYYGCLPGRLVYLCTRFLRQSGGDAMSNRRVRCLSAASVLALSLAWTGSAQALDQPTGLPVQKESLAASASVLSAADLLMSLSLQGYDLFSIGQFQAALEALLPAAAQQAGLAPAILATVRSLGFGQEHEAVVSLVLKDALAIAPSAQGEPIQLAQAEEVICDDDAALAGDCMMQIIPGLIPPGGVPALQNDGRGVENYSG